MRSMRLPRKASPAITGYPKLAPGNLVDVLGRYGYQDGWYKVYIADEHIGYVWADSVKPVDTEAYKDNRTGTGLCQVCGRGAEDLCGPSGTEEGFGCDHRVAEACQRKPCGCLRPGRL